MEFPESLKPFEEKARQSAHLHLFSDIEFSLGTYQIHIVDPELHRSFWTFLQLDRKGQIKDSFCECDDSEQTPSSCFHLALAYLGIFQQYEVPLHERFEYSFWNVLFREFAKEGTQLKNEKEGSYYWRSLDFSSFCSLKGKTKEASQKLSKLIEDRAPETEETSLKFSDLPQDELLLWRSGKPTPYLSYALSSWFDLAKWLFFLQEQEKKSRVHFEFLQGLPLKIEVEFEEVLFSCQITKGQLSSLVPTLPSLNPPFAVYDLFHQAIQKVVFDPLKKQVSLVWNENFYLSENVKKGVQIPGWIFVQKEGFYPKQPKRWTSEHPLEGEEVANLFDQFPKIKQVLEGASFHEEVQKLSYHLFFDAEWNLHLFPYLFEEGDLSHPEAAFFGHFVYLPKEGFYRLQEKPKINKPCVIKEAQVIDFIEKEKAYLSDLEGFTLHLVPFEFQLDYKLDSQDRLIFFECMDGDQETTTKIKDFGKWIFVTGEGFYPKGRPQAGGQIRPGMIFTKEQIPLMIEAHEEELKLLFGFFTKTCPVEKARLKVVFLKDETSLQAKIQVSPFYYFTEGVDPKDLRWFDTCVYQKGEGFFRLPPTRRLPQAFREIKQIQQEELAYFILHLLPELNPFIEYLDPYLEKPKELQLVIQKIQKKQEDLLSFKMVYQTERGEIDVFALFEALSKKERFYFDLAGLLDLYMPRFSWIRALYQQKKQPLKPYIQLSTLDFYRLCALENAIFSGADEESKQLWEELLSFTPPSLPNLDHLKSTLRPYQEKGVQWLWFLWCYRLSGLLCDDMGLGKTHQAMALIAAILSEKKEKQAPILIVCPTSVLFHWQDKLKEFLPSAKLLTFYGTGRTLDLVRHHYDILLTSYGVLRIETPLFSQLYFSLAIFDEIQIAKNHQSRLYASLLNIRRGMGLGLTGTPIENRLRELKSLFDLVLPSYMPEEKQFRELFIRPIEREESAFHRSLLSKLIRPFILRRKKAEVLSDLPEKMEEIAYCSLEEEQQRLYQELLDKEHVRLKDTLDTEKPIPYVHIFAILSKLKQICDHPAVFLKNPKAYREHVSGKWELFVELLQEALASQQKVVVFSQYLKMLDIIKFYLKEQGIVFAELRGSTQNRGEEVSRFRDDPSCAVFLGSLQAASWGVDLTAASVVIHYDRWWNAARENQATDRVHRIGQVRGVQVFKLVTKNTLEERIDQLISKKKDLMEGVIGLDDQSFIKTLSKEELFDLLSIKIPFSKLKN